MKIIFNGPPRSGKDEACNFLNFCYGFKHLTFKEQLFLDTCEYFNVSLDWFMSGYDDRTIKETKTECLNNLSRREALIHVSETIIKPAYGKDYYGRCVVDKLDGVSSYCFSDGGFLDEIYPIINSFGTKTLSIVQIFRDGCSFSSDSRCYLSGILQEEFILGSKTDNTEYIPQLPIRMYRIHNNSSVSDFHKTIRTIIRKEANVNQENDISREPVRRRNDL